MTRSSLLRSGVLLGGIVLLGVGCPQQKPVQTTDIPLAVTEEPTEPPVISTTTQEVAVTSSGFSPATVTVPANTTVVFRNADTAPHWVASDPHPVHTGLSGFDAGADIAPGEIYSFLFTAPGTFTYHDHLKPNLKGTVVVE